MVSKYHQLGCARIGLQNITAVCMKKTILHQKKKM